jgi:mono/diheme cytochrome c family protein
MAMRKRSRWDAGLVGRGLVIAAGLSSMACQQPGWREAERDFEGSGAADGFGKGGSVGFAGKGGSSGASQGPGQLPVGPIVSADPAPPPVAGGTLLVARDGVAAVAADPDRDRVFLVDLDGNALMHSIELAAGAEPGRVIEDDARRVHVVLRGSGEIATISLDDGSLVGKRSVCPAPRGIAFDAAKQALHVACDTGELVTLPVEGTTIVRKLELERDLRDVVVDGDRLVVSRFRSAEILVVDAAGAVVKRVAPPSALGTSGANLEPAVARRMLPMPDGRVAVLHQRHSTAPIFIGEPNGYGGGTGDPCTGSLVETTVTPVEPDENEGGGAIDIVSPRPAAPPLAFAVVGTDLAISADGLVFAAVSIGNSWTLGGLGNLLLSPVDPPEGAGTCHASVTQGHVAGEPVAVAFDGSGRVIVQSREPASLHVFDGTTALTDIPLSDVSRADTGLQLFHMNPGSSIACASCHPEGRDDGHVWNFDPIGPRRTQSLAGGVLATAPFHWNGDMLDLRMLLGDVFIKRMGGGSPTPEQESALAKWLEAVKAPAPMVVDDAQAVARGKLLFEDEIVGCVDCHGTDIPTNESADIGTGGDFQPPRLLGVSARAPFLHNGCAETLHDRFGACNSANDQHGMTSHLAPAQIDDLVAYLESL